MLNKLLIIFAIILNNFFLYYAYSDDQINFDVSQIEVLEGGDKIIGKKRGTITTYDGVIINADEFEYDKVKKVLKAKGNITVNDKANDYIINSENILYLRDQERIQIETTFKEYEDGRLVSGKSTVETAELIYSQSLKVFYELLIDNYEKQIQRID